MKKLLLLLFTPVLLASIPSVSLSETRPWLETDADLPKGVGIEEVTAVLGEPLGSLGSDTFRIYHFDRGEVVFRDGQLVSHSLVSEEEARARREEAAEHRERLRAEREERRAQRYADGEEIKERHLSDPAFSELSPRVRVAFWQRFQRKYPDNDVGLYLTLAREEVREADRLRRAEEERERRIMAAEARIAEAEARARQAEARAAQRERVIHHETVVREPRRRHHRSDGHRHRHSDEPKDPPAEKSPSEPRPIVREPPPPPAGSEAYPFQRNPKQQDGPYAFPRDPAQSGPYPFTGERKK